MNSSDSGSSQPNSPSTDPDSPAPVPSYFWVWVMCLLGLDYFSTLAYQPSITQEVAGRVGPLATLVVVLVTLFGALPVYYYLVGRSPEGQGSLGLLERLVRGWKGKTLVLLLLGFAAADFTLLKSVSLATAAVHTLKSEDAGWQQLLADLTGWLREHVTNHFGAEAAAYFTPQLVATLLLGVVGFLFWYLLRRGFNRNVVILAVPLVGLFMLLNALLLIGGLVHVFSTPGLLSTWMEDVQAGRWGQGLAGAPGMGLGWAGVVLFSLLVLPKVALGLSGFEMNMMLMPQVRGAPGDNPQNQRGRIRNTRKVLVTAAVIMSVYLLASSLVTCLLVPERALGPPGPGFEDGKATNRVLAYLAHGGELSTGAKLFSWCGPALGSLYDLVTVLVLCLAGTGVMTALAVYLPQFLLRFGMELRWAHRWGVILIVFALVNVAVTVYFQASVSAQRDAYAIGVLVLIASAAVTAYLDKKKPGAEQPAGRLNRWYFWFVAAGFVMLAVVIAVHAFSGLAIAFLFILALLAMSVISRALRADELRTIGFDFQDDQSHFLWDSLRLADFPVLVPHRPGRHERQDKDLQIRRDHQLDPDADVVFVEVEVDDPSNFYQRLLLQVYREDNRTVIKVTRCVSVAHAVAAIALELSRHSKPPGLHFGWSELDSLTASWSYFAFGEGNIPWKVRDLIMAAEPDPAKRPRVVIG